MNLNGWHTCKTKPKEDGVYLVYIRPDFAPMMFCSDLYAINRDDFWYMRNMKDRSGWIEKWADGHLVQLAPEFWTDLPEPLKGDVIK